MLARDTRAGLLLVLAAGLWLLAMVAYGLLGLNTAPRLEPAMIASCRSPAVSLALLEQRLPPGRWRWMLRIAAGVVLVCLWHRGMDRDHAVRVRIAEQNRQLARAVDQAASPGDGTWLIDNDVASLLALATRLGVARIANLQQELLAPTAEAVAGVVVDDRLGRPKGGTLGQPRLAPLIAPRRPIYEDRPGVIVFGPASR
ncbi:MAG: hypothetical protein U1E76_23280 [Planctomycetota bacterium]